MMKICVYMMALLKPGMLPFRIGVYKNV